MSECRELAAWAEALPIAAPLLASPDQLTKNLQLIQATLPSRNVDDAAGERRTAAYLAVLQGYSLGQIKFLSDRAIRTLRWFPTPAECLEIIADYRPPETERAATLRLCQAFADDAFAVWLANVADGQPIGDVPEGWCRIAVERGVMRRLADGSYVSRALYHGPVKAWSPAPARPASDITVPDEPMREAA